MCLSRAGIPAKPLLLALAADVAEVLVGERAELAVWGRATKLLPQRGDGLLNIGGLRDADIFGDDRVKNRWVNAGNRVATHAHDGLLVEPAGGAETRDDDAESKDLVLGAQREIGH